MSAVTESVSRYVKTQNINLSAMSRETGIPYMPLYDSLLNDRRDRDLRVGEFFLICEFLDKDPNCFAVKKTMKE